mmetsp:Transcript_7895/g.48820  ORF Transcript_7895/g.48820 Transcript_7895/m.48820 type:complete len:87 (+) Transcript_7895:109-369(+)
MEHSRVSEQRTSASDADLGPWEDRSLDGSSPGSHPTTKARFLGGSCPVLSLVEQAQAIPLSSARNRTVRRAVIVSAEEEFAVARSS